MYVRSGFKSPEFKVRCKTGGWFNSCFTELISVINEFCCLTVWAILGFSFVFQVQVSSKCRSVMHVKLSGSGFGSDWYEVRFIFWDLWKCFCKLWKRAEKRRLHMFSQKDVESLRNSRRGDLSRTTAPPASQKSRHLQPDPLRTRCSVCSFVQRVSERAMLARAWRRWHAASLRVLGGFPESRPEKKDRVNAGSRNKYLRSAPHYRTTTTHTQELHSELTCQPHTDIPELGFIVVSSLTADNRVRGVGSGFMLSGLFALTLEQCFHIFRKNKKEFLHWELCLISLFLTLKTDECKNDHRPGHSLFEWTVTLNKHWWIKTKPWSQVIYEISAVKDSLLHFVSCRLLF